MLPFEYQIYQLNCCFAICYSIYEKLFSFALFPRFAIRILPFFFFFLHRAYFNARVRTAAAVAAAAISIWGPVCTIVLFCNVNEWSSHHLLARALDRMADGRSCGSRPQQMETIKVPLPPPPPLCVCIKSFLFSHESESDFLFSRVFHFHLHYLTDSPENTCRRPPLGFRKFKCNVGD